jgi:hypothetical protein
MTTPPSSIDEVMDQWVSQVYLDLTANYLDSEWASITLPSVSCLTELKTGFF